MSGREMLMLDAGMLIFDGEINAQGEDRLISSAEPSMSSSDISMLREEINVSSGEMLTPSAKMLISCLKILISPGKMLISVAKVSALTPGGSCPPTSILRACEKIGPPQVGSS